jgi:site-specific DNA recombinase
VQSTNGHGPKRAVLYARVSGEEQAKKGYSLADQLDALRDWCSRNDHEIIDEVQDKGFSGAYLERPGLDRVREIVAAGRVDAVVVLFRDRIARGVYAQLLSEEFREYGARLVALNSRGDGSPDGELGDNILDVIAAWERKKIAERMNRGKRRKAREGKIVAGPRPHYGFRFNETRDGYVLDEEKMSVVRRIFNMVGVKGMTLNAVRRTLENDCISSPSGARHWSNQYLRNCINDDVYLAHTFAEISELISSEVAAALDPSRNYGIWYYGTERHTYSQKRETAPDGSLRYRKIKKSVPVPREDWVAVPVPDAGIPREWVIAARDSIERNRWFSNAGHRVWELTGGVIRCAECGRAMGTNYIASRGRNYYRCTGHYNGGLEKCPMNRSLRADEAERQVWEFVSGILTDSARLTRGLEKMLENEREPSAGEDEASWLKRIAEINVKQERLLDLHLDGDITTGQFRSKTEELKQARVAAEDQLEAARSRRSRLEDIEHSKEALISHYASLVPSSLRELSPEERRHVYRMMHLRVLAHRDDTLIADWGCNDVPLPPDSCRTRGR